MSEIYVDGDACPVKGEVLRVAERRRLVVHMVSNSGFNARGNPLIRAVMVATPRMRRTIGSRRGLAPATSR